MMRSLFSGVAGLKGHQTRMDVIGNNIANVNTTGFKSSRVTFADTLNQTTSGASAPGDTIGGTNPKQIGLGVGISSIDLLFTDGSVQSTGKNTDLCMSGNGLFIVKQGNDTYYTRDGAFEFDAEGNYVLPGNGMFVQGWMAKDGVLSTTGAVENIQVQTGKSMEAAATKIATYTNNLDAATKGYEISSILVTKTDGTTETVDNYNPKNYEGNIWITCGRGKFLVSNKPYYKVGEEVEFSICYLDNKIDSITANATEQVELTVTNPHVNKTDETRVYTAVNDTVIDKFTIPSSAVKSGTYSIGGAYSTVKEIKEVIHEEDAEGNDNIKLIFTDNSDGISSVTVPEVYGEYAVGDSFNLTLEVTGGKAKKGATIKDNETGNVLTLVDGDPEAVLGEPYVIKEVPTALTNTSAVESVTINTADGKSLPGLVNFSYEKGKTFYSPVTTTVPVYDSLGNAHSIPVLFTKTAENTWSLSLKGGATSTTITENDGTTTTVNLTSTDLKFDTSGKYVSGSGELSLSYTNGAEDGTVAINLSAITQYAGNSTINGTADGNAAGTLKSVSIDSTGTITGVYTNGKKQAEAQVAVAQFNNASGLTKVGSSLYQTSMNSHPNGNEPTPHTATDLGVTITASALEMSNVDIANEFSDMIITQRGFQSNSKIITVGDEMLETLINMKR